MDVQATAYLLVSGLHIERDDQFVNQLSRVWPDDLRTQQSVRVSVRHKLDEAVGLRHGFGTGHSSKRMLTEFDRVASLAGLGCRQPHGSDLRVGKDGIGHVTARRRHIFALDEAVVEPVRIVARAVPGAC